MFLEELVQQALGWFRIAPALDQDIKYEPVLIDSAPEPMLPAGDVDHDLVQVPLVTGCRKPANLVGEALAKLQRPLPHGLMADQDASGRQHVLNHTQAEGKPEVHPDGVADHFSRNAAAGITRSTNRLQPSRITRSGSLIG